MWNLTLYNFIWKVNSELQKTSMYDKIYFHQANFGGQIFYTSGHSKIDATSNFYTFSDAFFFFILPKMRDLWQEKTERSTFVDGFISSGQVSLTFFLLSLMGNKNMKLHAKGVEGKKKMSWWGFFAKHSFFCFSSEQGAERKRELLSAAALVKL